MSNPVSRRFLPALLALAALASAGAARAAELFPTAPAWVQDQTLYEVNLRQFSQAGTVNGFREQLPRLQQLGVGTLWFMPVNPIGAEGRSGTLGSPYAVRDYTAFNPEFGTLDDFKATVDEAHRRGMFVIIDWVANHTALDHPWVGQHPDWYKHDAAGKLVPPMETWKDVAALDFASPALRKAMIEAMAFWVREAGVDGFRCDTAEFVPLDFWVEARDALRAIKPVFMLAEGVKPELLDRAFDAAYAWNLPPNMEGIAEGTKTVTDLVGYLRADPPLLPGDGFRLNFVTNHDKNSWEGTDKKLVGGGGAAFTVLTFTVGGMPLIYNGQEAGLDKQLAFFERDPIPWRDDPAADLYRKLAALKRENRALWSGAGSAAKILDAQTTASVLTFTRENEGDRVAVVLNLSAQPQTAATPPVEGMSVALESGATDQAGKIALKPWGYRVWSGVR